jgi:hypothetical protein
MTYYEEVVEKIENAVKAYPPKTVVMDAETFKVLATGKDAARLGCKFRRERTPNARAVFFRQPRYFQ